jgi:uracil-DNA glycosylase
MEDPMNALLGCTDCPRLAGSLAAIRSAHPDYHARPVLPFGDTNARLLIVGLAPGMHGANRTGRPFTGDYAGVLLYETLHEFGFANRPQSLGRRRWPSADGLPHYQRGEMPTPQEQTGD